MDSILRKRLGNSLTVEDFRFDRTTQFAQWLIGKFGAKNRFCSTKMQAGFGKTLYGAILALPWFPRVCWVCLLVGLLLGNLAGWAGKKGTVLLCKSSFRHLNVVVSSESLSDLRGTTVLITGSSMGIGEHIAYQFAQHGARIVITARSEDKLQQVVTKCRELGASQVYYFVADMANSNQINHLIEVKRQAAS